ncbi:LOW QUALITY PROTEIN: hypothetical protein OSB04_010306 [Centaurea solstitialis]|uniref:Pentatricopeptide repeat-containing protein-mitochondrial domain-containing protein n=1 Tax=Centaurea solstitialis TaxID=347529 RepID=A0AA38WCQ2_9ASTR|nr:LOW QUALITY PROTEIN: hypothetical protein OSB04_010306 [Centaurea solstitialis]
MGLVQLRCLSLPKRLISYHSSPTTAFSSSNQLAHKLIQQPISGIKKALDSENFGIQFSSWDSLLTSVHSSSPQKAQLVLKWRLEHLLKENEKNCDAFSDLIHLCGKIKNTQAAMHVFTSMENHGLKPTPIVLDALISAHLSSGNVITALSIFQTMQNSEHCKPTSRTYNLFISALANLGNSKSMLAWYSAKMASGFSADLDTYEALILGSITLKRFQDADRFYREMLAAGIEPNTLILHGMLAGFCERKDLDKIRVFWKDVLDRRWEINGQMVEKLVGFYCELELVEELEWMLVILTEAKPNQDSDIISRIHNGLIRVYAKLDRLDDMEYAVGRMLKQGVLFSSHKDVEKVLCSYFRKDRLDVFLEFVKASHKLPRSTYELLVAGYRRAGLYKKVELVIEDLEMVGTTH